MNGYQSDASSKCLGTNRFQFIVYRHIHQIFAAGKSGRTDGGHLSRQDNAGQLAVIGKNAAADFFNDIIADFFRNHNNRVAAGICGDFAIPSGGSGNRKAFLRRRFQFVFQAVFHGILIGIAEWFARNHQLGTAFKGSLPDLLYCGGNRYPFQPRAAIESMLADLRRSLRDHDLLNGGVVQEGIVLHLLQRCRQRQHRRRLLGPCGRGQCDHKQQHAKPENPSSAFHNQSPYKISFPRNKRKTNAYGKAKQPFSYTLTNEETQRNGHLHYSTAYIKSLLHFLKIN